MRPELGVSTEAKVLRVIDGDTIEVEVSRKFNVRFRDVKKPELRTPEGKIAKADLANKLPVGAEVTLFIPTNNAHKLMDFNSFERIVADVYIGDEKCT